MLRSFGIRAKILAILALPVLVLSLAAGVIATSATAEARRASQVEQLTRQASGLTDLLRGLQAERALSVAVLSGDAASRASLEEIRVQVSAGLEGVRSELGTVDMSQLDEGARAGALASTQAHDLIPDLRSQIDGGVLTPALALTRYSEVIAADIALPAAIADGLEDQQLAQALRAYTATEELAEAIAIERDLAVPAVAAGVFTPEQLVASREAAQRADLVRENTTRVAQAAGVRTPSVEYVLQLARQKTILNADGVVGEIDVATWRSAAEEDVAALTTGLQTVVAASQARSADLATEAAQYALQVILGTVLSVAVPVLLALLLARRITRPLRRLTEAAAQIREDLPKMVERMATPGEGPGMTVPEIPVESNDEIGRLAAAFNDVNTTTVQVAQEQAALRGSIAAMFVNVARRDQVLLSRQLSFLDKLERTEENPDTLDNLFKLDHLATRMRRNAESLLVLAGIDSGRRLRRPMPLSDVVRTASSEIEHYERVDLALLVDPPMVGHTALLTAHLMAELLENATSFSDPSTRVVVSTDAGPNGIVVTIDDDGLGMSADELDEANDRIQNPPVSEVVGAQRLGFYVVGRLASRLDIHITLSAGDGRGTVVTIELPPALFVPGSVVAEGLSDGESDADAEGDGEGDGEDAAGAAPSTRSTPTIPADIAPTGASELGASAEALNGAAAAAAAASLTPLIIPAGTAGLPQRGGAAPGLPKRSAPATGDALPTRTPSAKLPVEPPPGVPGPRTEAPAPEARSGLFTGFRARRAEAVGTVANHGGSTAAARVELPAPAPIEVPEVAVLDDEPVTAELADLPVPVAELPVPSAVEDDPAAPTPQSDEPVAPPAAHRSGPGQGRSAASELAALATRPAPAQQAPAPVAQTFTSASALDILPGATRGKSSSRGLKLPRRGRDGDVPAARQPSDSPMPVHPASSPHAPAQPPVADAGTLVPVVAALSEGAEAFVPTRSVGDTLRQRSALASEALSELSRLSSYRPDATVSTSGSGAPALIRRTRGASPAAEVAAPQQADPSRPGRSAADVRSMLSGFQAGVTRGRNTPAPTQDVSE